MIRIAPLPPADADVVRVEVADRLKAIGRLGEHVASGKATPRYALDIAVELVEICRQYVNDDGGSK